MLALNYRSLFYWLCDVPQLTEDHTTRLCFKAALFLFFSHTILILFLISDVMVDTLLLLGTSGAQMVWSPVACITLILVSDFIFVLVVAFGNLLA